MTEVRYSSGQVMTSRLEAPDHADLGMLAKYDEMPTTCLRRLPERVSVGGGLPLERVQCPERVQTIDKGEYLLRSAYLRGDYARLDALWANWCTGQPRFADGRWVLGAFRTGLEKAFQSDEDYPAHERRIRDWQLARPGSVAARFALAVHGRHWAWQARGNGYSNEVSKEAWMLFGKRIEPAAQGIHELISEGPDCAAPYQLALHLFGEVGAAPDLLEQVYEVGAKRFPDNHEIHLAMARSLEPRWGGSIEAYHAFVNKVVARTRPTEGSGMYARLFRSVDFDPMKFAPGKKGSPEWKRLRESLDGLVKRFPDSAQIASMSADFSCRTDDSARYRRDRARFVGQESDFPLGGGVEACDQRHGWPVAQTARLKVDR